MGTKVKPNITIFLILGEDAGHGVSPRRRRHVGAKNMTGLPAIIRGRSANIDRRRIAGGSSRPFARLVSQCCHQENRIYADKAQRSPGRAGNPAFPEKNTRFWRYPDMEQGSMSLAMEYCK